MPQLSGTSIGTIEAFLLGAVVAVLSATIDHLTNPPTNWTTVGVLAMGAFLTYLLAYLRGLVRMPDGTKKP